MKQPGRSSVFEYLLTHHRGWFAVLLLIPASVLFNTWEKLQNFFTSLLEDKTASHERKVKFVQQQIEDWKQSGAATKLCTARSGWKTMSELVPKYKLTSRQIQVNMRSVLNIDPENKTVRVEPLANMSQISAELLPKGWTLAVVPELDDLTVGGLIMGFGVETSSHKYGLFQYICQSLEIVTAEGKWLKCSATENAELFYALPWSYGTLGFLVAAELKIIPASPYVRLHYRALHGLDNIVQAFEQASRDTRNDFVEALQYSADTAVLMCGTFAERPGADGKVNAIGRWYKPWFYKHAQKALKEENDLVEYIPLRHYYHRHTRSLFWEMENIIPAGNHPLFRFLLGWALPPRLELLKKTETETTKRLREQYHVVQDMLMPISKLKQSIQYFDAHFAVYPLWLSPMCIYSTPGYEGFLQPYENDPLFVDIGAYGTSAYKDFNAPAALNALEEFVANNHGYQALYAKTGMNEALFRLMFNHTLYDRLRNQLPFCHRAFDDVYTKVAHGRVAPSDLRKMKIGS